MGRKLRSYEQIAGDAEVLLAKNNYNEVGQLKGKTLGNAIQNTNYTYNERGWLKRSTSDQFSLQLKYQDGTTPQFNGNISGQSWGTGTSFGSSFVYDYDKLNRLTSGISTNMSEVVSNNVMGNIESLKRDAAVPRVYTYAGNQLFRTTGIATSQDYVYDENGNAKVDGRLGKTFTYNTLNLPATVSNGPSYTYDATGNKLKKISGTVTTDYIDGIQYTSGAIELIQTETGIARKSDSSYVYAYNLTDHLGNVRYSFQKSPITGSLERLQSDDYYPFGLQKLVVGGTNKYLYNGKEVQDELGGQYDYGARFYDPAIGRFNTIDPLSEISRRNNPYGYALNNPISFVDVDGMYVDDYVFDENGDYVRTDRNNKPNKLVVEYSKTKESKSYSFNDAENDVKAIENAIASGGEVGINKVTILTDAEVERQIQDSGVKGHDAQDPPLSYAKAQGDKKMDFGVKGIRSGVFNPKSFYIREGVAYNVGDIGNYMWGRGMAELGIDLKTSALGTQYNNIFNGRRQHTALYDFGPGTYNSPGILDSPGDQRAIKNGYTNSPAGNAIIEKEIKRIRNNSLYGPKF